MDYKLKEYSKKRDFEKTTEPKPHVGKKGDKSIFAVQKHESSHLHYDLRIEINGVLKSWAVPKGPSLNPKDKRLAILTEDHPIDYADFEGIIPEGNYGAGVVMVWDIGTYKNINEKNGKLIEMEKSFEDGHIIVKLDGEKLKGGFAITKFGKGKDKKWLLIKKRDDNSESKDITKDKPNSVLSGASLSKIEKETK